MPTNRGMGTQNQWHDPPYPLGKFEVIQTNLAKFFDTFVKANQGNQENWQIISMPIFGKVSKVT